MTRVQTEVEKVRHPISELLDVLRPISVLLAPFVCTSGEDMGCKAHDFPGPLMEDGYRLLGDVERAVTRALDAMEHMVDEGHTPAFGEDLLMDAEAVLVPMRWCARSLRHSYRADSGATEDAVEIMDSLGSQMRWLTTEVREGENTD